VRLAAQASKSKAFRSHVRTAPLRGFMRCAQTTPCILTCTSLAGRVTFGKRPKSNQKRWSPVIAPAVGGSPVFLGSEGRCGLP